MCGIELPEKSLDQGRRYAFQLNAFLPNGMSSRSRCALSPPITCPSRILGPASGPGPGPRRQRCHQRPLVPPYSWCHQRPLAPPFSWCHQRCLAPPFSSPLPARLRGLAWHEAMMRGHRVHVDSCHQDSSPAAHTARARAHACTHTHTHTRLVDRSTVAVETLPEPLGGELRVHPPSGVSLVTDFTVRYRRGEGRARAGWG